MGFKPILFLVCFSILLLNFSGWIYSVKDVLSNVKEVREKPEAFASLGQRVAIERHFKSVWTTELKAEALRLTAAMDEVFRYHNVSYFQTKDTLWGSINMKDYIPWQSQLNFAVEPFNETVQQTLLNRSILVTQVTPEMLQLTFDGRNTTNATITTITLHIIKTENDSILVHGQVFKYADIFPLRRSSLNLIMLSTPARPEVILSTMYGSDNSVQCPHFTMNIAVPCVLLNETYGYQFASFVSPPEPIPRIIHQLWIGKSKKPPLDIMETCKQLHSQNGWQYIFWTDENLPNITMTEAFRAVPQSDYLRKADLYRIEILAQYGGIWVDADTYCLRPFDDLVQDDLSLFSGYHNLKNPHLQKEQYGEREFLIETNVMGASKAHPIIMEVVKLFQNNSKEATKAAPWKTTGPLRMTEYWKKFQGKLSMHHSNYPCYYFVPYHALELTKTNEQEKFQDKAIRYRSYAANTWGTTLAKYKPVRSL